MYAPPPFVGQGQPPVLVGQAVTGVPMGGYPAAQKTIVTVPIPLQSQGGLRFQENSYSLALQNVLSRAEFDEIVAELNDTCKKYAPNVGAHMAVLMVPLLGLPALPVLIYKMNRLKREINETCACISRCKADRGINLRVVEVIQPSYGTTEMHVSNNDVYYQRRGGSYNTFRVDLEMAV